MSTNTLNIIDKLKSEIHCLTSEKIKNQKIELTLRNKERAISEELATVQASTSFIQNQIKEMRRQVTELKNLIDMIEICNSSEKSKIENYFLGLAQHKKGFDELFAKESDLMQIQHDQQRQILAEKDEIETQKQAKIQEIDEQMGLEASTIERESEEIERECGVLTKRNRAIMLQLRRKLIESEATRKELMKTIDTEPCCYNK